jgi:hypothetical protein
MGGKGQDLHGDHFYHWDTH